MKKVPCNGPGCETRRIHYESPETPRGIVLVEVPDEYEGNAFCSIECYSYYKTTNASKTLPKQSY